MAITNIIAIASSTGGPGILKELFSGMPRLNAGLLIVQHMPKSINESIAKSLNDISGLDVRVAQHGDFIQKGTGFVAPSDIHMVVQGGRIALVTGERVNFVCPAADVTMKSLKRPLGAMLIGVVLTGMGKDGASGAAHIKECGGITIAEDEASSPIFGMPKAAIETGKVDYILPPDKIRNKLIELVGIA